MLGQVGVLGFALLGFVAGFHQPSFAPPSQDCITQPGPWSPCSVSCGSTGGTRTRQIQIIQRPLGYGRACPYATSETEPCDAGPCPVDCIVQAGALSQCSASCGDGVQTKTDTIIQQAAHGGIPCPVNLVTTVACNAGPCPIPIDCEIGYTPYSLCSQPCGGGTQSRTAFIITPAANGGAPCPADLAELTDERQCNTDVPCTQPQNCEFTTGEFGACSAQCGSGTMTRRIYIISEPSNGGLACPTELVEVRPCVGPQGPCPQPQDCLVEYPPFSPCSRTCGSGTQTTTGRVIRQATAGGAPCPSYAQLSVTRTCADTPCIAVAPRDCEVVVGAFSACSASCGGGYATAKSYVKNEGENGGLACPAQATTRVSCNAQPCVQPKDCLVQQGYWSQCSASCGGGVQTRHLTILEHATYGGSPCPTSLVETRSCNTRACIQALPTTYGGVQRPSLTSGGFGSGSFSSASASAHASTLARNQALASAQAQAIASSQASALAAARARSAANATPFKATADTRRPGAYGQRFVRPQPLVGSSTAFSGAAASSNAFSSAASARASAFAQSSANHHPAQSRPSLTVGQLVQGNARQLIGPLRPQQAPKTTFDFSGYGRQ